MKNGQRYISQRCPYDMMCDMLNHTEICPIYAISGRYNAAFCINEDFNGERLVLNEICKNCIQNWLNKEDCNYEKHTLERNT